ncbi:hypothetical protein ABZ588_08300 [Streptomyces althioticus]|uniref:hypothetical protein n=1 Tax=Streptomyces althioticus TaxID=83380 RepID=UPI0033C1C90C
MSAPVAVNTADGTCWTRRGETRRGEALYAPEGVCNCPPFVMATLSELAEHGIVGSAYALPMPVGPERKSRGVLDRARDAVDARMSKDALRHVLQNVISYAARLENRVAELETFAHGCDAEGCVLPHSSWCERAKKTAAENDGCTCGKPWVGHPQPHAAHCWVVSPPRDEVEKLRARVAELEAKAATARTEAIADVGDWLDEHGEKNAAHLVYTCDIPAARDMVTHVVADDSDDPEHVDDCPGCKTQQTGGAE